VLLQNTKQPTRSVGCKNRATLPTPFVFMSMRDSRGSRARNFDRFERQKFSLRRSKTNPSRGRC
jgi:hypothetical protein